MANLRNNRLRRVGASSFLLAAVCLSAACDDKSVATTEDELEANQMFVLLHSKDLSVEKIPKANEKPGWDIVINEGWFGEGEAAVAMQVLNDHGLPRAKEALPEKTNPWGTSPEEERKRQNREKEIQIERQLYDLPGVIKVRVVIAQPAGDTLSVLSGNKTPPTASVLIVQKESTPRFSETDVRNQVSGTVSDLKPESIQVTTTYQPLREISLEKLAAQRRSNTIYALGTGLIIFLASALGAIWYSLRRRRKQTESDAEQLTASEDEPEISGFKRSALTAADEEE